MNKEHYVKRAYELVWESEKKHNIRVDEVSEHYLIMLIAGYFDNPELPSNEAIRTQMLQARSAPTKELKWYKYKYVGDNCLMTSGITPFANYRRGITPKYYVDMGIRAYGSLSLLHQQEHNVFNHVSEQFAILRDILEGIFSSREYTTMQLIDLVDSGSKISKTKLSPKIIIGPWKKQ